MKRLRLLFVVLCACLMLTACTVTDPSRFTGTETPEQSVSIESSEATMPESMRELAENPNTEWLNGIWVEATNCELLQEWSKDSCEVYARPDDHMQVICKVQNGLDKEQSYSLIILADGVPVTFSIDQKDYLSYPVILTPEQSMLLINFSPEFSLNLGRLDFLLCYNENPQSDYHVNNYTIWVDLDEDAVAPAHVQETVDQRPYLQGSYHDNAYGAWLWNQEMKLSETDSTGPRKINIGTGEKLLLEAIAAKAGLYRTVLIVNGQPAAFVSEGEEYTYLDWQSAGTDMLQVPVEFIDQKEADGSFFTVSTPLDPELMKSMPLASGKIQLAAK